MSRPAHQPARTARRPALGRGLSGLLNRLRAPFATANPTLPPDPTGPTRLSPAGEPPATSGSLRDRLHARPVSSTDLPSGPRPTSAPTPATAPPAAPAEVAFVPIDSIHPAPGYPIRQVGAEPLSRLAESIRAVGFCQPLVVAPFTATGPGAHEFQVIFGHRRLLAARQAGLTQVPVLIRHVAPALGLQLALADAIHREPLDGFDRARCLAGFRQQTDLSWPEIAALLQYPVEAIDRDLALLTVEPEIRSAVTAGRIDLAQVGALLEAPTERQRQRLWHLAERYHWTPDRMRAKLTAWQSAN